MSAENLISFPYYESRLVQRHRSIRASKLNSLSYATGDATRTPLPY